MEDKIIRTRNNGNEVWYLGEVREDKIIKRIIGGVEKVVKKEEEKQPQQVELN